uniref:Uncharacterized protein n=1 Tax=Anopheles coluzzii TaxID=1518534 RepID=A0A8W7PYZ8_ANOCL
MAVVVRLVDGIVAAGAALPVDVRAEPQLAHVGKLVGWLIRWFSLGCLLLLLLLLLFRLYFANPFGFASSSSSSSSPSSSSSSSSTSAVSSSSSRRAGPSPSSGDLGERTSVSCLPAAPFTLPMYVVSIVFERSSSTG